MGRAGAVAGILVVLLLFASPARALDADIVSLNNGDVHNGNLALPFFGLETAYGEISLPLAFVAMIRREGGLFRLETVEGESFTGRPTLSTITLFRILDPPLAIHFADMAEIRFAPRPLRSVVTLPVPDMVETASGDRFRAGILEADLDFTPDAGEGKGDGVAISLTSVHTLDIDRASDGSLRAMIRLNGEKQPKIGSIEGEVTLALRHGDRLTLSLSNVSSIALDVLPGRMVVPPPLEYSYLGRLVPGRIFRDALRDGSFGPAMAIVRGGRFMRGDDAGDDDEKPASRVELARPFAIGVFEITFDEYDHFCIMTRRGCPDDHGWGRGSRPAINVSWDDAKAYAEWLSEMTGERYRLPSDAEWEYAARGGTSGNYWWGDAIGEANANCGDCGGLWAGDKTAPVGRFPANPFGLFDTAGNVFEWVLDCWHDRFAEAPRDGSPMENPHGCGQRTYRGGSWGFPPKESRSANRWRDFPTGSSDDMGFRMVRELER